jgi:hypothetical protein
VEQRRPNLGLSMSRVDFCRGWKRDSWARGTVAIYQAPAELAVKI